MTNVFIGIIIRSCITFMCKFDCIYTFILSTFLKNNLEMKTCQKFENNESWPNLSGFCKKERQPAYLLAA